MRIEFILVSGWKESGKMYVIDTNAFYYAAGISECTYDVERLRNLIENNNTFISSTSLFEFLIKYRDDINTIHKGGEYLCEKKIKLAGNVFNPLPDGFSCDIMNIPDEAFKTLCEKILENKIDIESRFISLLFDMCIFSGCYFVAMSDGTEPSRFCYEILVKICKLLGQINLDIFVDIFTEGYKTDDCENYVRHSFYNLLAFELKQYIPFVEKAKLIGDNDNIPDIDVWLPLEDYTSRVEQFSSMMEHKTSAQFLHRIAVEYWKNNNDPELKKYINELQNRFNKKVKHKALQEYFYDTLVRIMTSGAALWKNDFLDALILCNVQDKNLLITYDNGVIKQMKRREDENLKYKESLSVISNLKKL